MFSRVMTKPKAPAAATMNMIMAVEVTELTRISLIFLNFSSL